MVRMIDGAMQDFALTLDKFLDRHRTIRGDRLQCRVGSLLVLIFS